MSVGVQNAPRLGVSTTPSTCEQTPNGSGVSGKPKNERCLEMAKFWVTFEVEVDAETEEIAVELAKSKFASDPPEPVLVENDEGE